MAYLKSSPVELRYLSICVPGLKILSGLWNSCRNWCVDHIFMLQRAGVCLAVSRLSCTLPLSMGRLPGITFLVPAQTFASHFPLVSTSPGLLSHHSVHSARLLFPQYCCWEKHPPLKDDFLTPLLTSSQEISTLKANQKKYWTAHCSPSNSFLSTDSAAPVYSNCCNPSKSILCH